MTHPLFIDDADDDSISLGLNFYVGDLVMKANEEAALKGRLLPRGKRPLPPPVLSLLMEFAEERIGRANREGKRVKGLKSLLELKRAIEWLDLVGLPGWKPFIQQTNACLDRLHVTAKQCILRDVLDRRTSPADVALYTGWINEVCRRGDWPSFPPARAFEYVAILGQSRRDRCKLHVQTSLARRQAVFQTFRGLLVLDNAEQSKFSSRYDLAGGCANGGTKFCWHNENVLAP
jgi:hypothetical protein